MGLGIDEKLDKLDIGKKEVNRKNSDLALSVNSGDFDKDMELSDEEKDVVIDDDIAAPSPLKK